MFILSINRGKSAKKKKKVAFTGSRIQASVPTSAKEKKEKGMQETSEGSDQEIKRE